MIALLWFKELGCTHMFSFLYAWFSFFKRSAWKWVFLDLFCHLIKLKRKLCFMVFSFCSLWFCKRLILPLIQKRKFLIFENNCIEIRTIGSLTRFIRFQKSSFFFYILRSGLVKKYIIGIRLNLFIFVKDFENFLGYHLVLVSFFLGKVILLHI